MKPRTLVVLFVAFTVLGVAAKLHQQPVPSADLKPTTPVEAPRVESEPGPKPPTKAPLLSAASEPQPQPQPQPASHTDLDTPDPWHDQALSIAKSYIQAFSIVTTSRRVTRTTIR